jgi:hypothetical protein
VLAAIAAVTRDDDEVELDGGHPGERDDVDDRRRGRSGERDDDDRPRGRFGRDGGRTGEPDADDGRERGRFDRNGGKQGSKLDGERDGRRRDPITQEYES